MFGKSTEDGLRLLTAVVALLTALVGLAAILLGRVG